MNRLGILLLLAALGIQSVSHSSHRFVVDDPVELAHVKIADDFENQKSSGRFKIDVAAILFVADAAPEGFIRFECSELLCVRSLGHSDAYLKRGPPIL